MCSRLLILLLAGLSQTLTTVAAIPQQTFGDTGCIACHAGKTTGFAAPHAFGKVQCTPCHGGNPQTRDQAEAHAALIAFPGNLDNARQVCGPCHATQVEAVITGFMHRGPGIVEHTRRALGEAVDDQSASELGHLGQDPADSLLRKLCAGCHLGHPRTARRLDSPRHGGGCLACHIDSYPPSAHPQLTVRVASQRCFGCHSRSARASLNYQGLAEVEADAWQRQDDTGLQRLADGRLVESLSPDVHHRAGMGCTDCHTGRGLMASAVGLDHAQQAVDIGCRDCHLNTQHRIRLQDWPRDYAGYLNRIPFSADPDQPFLVTERNGTPLWHIEVRGENHYLHTKADGKMIEIPRFRQQTHEPIAAHERLTCSVCHSQWAPQCFGCHIQFLPDKRQWDHQEGKITLGRWQEERWMIRNGPSILGVRYDGRIAPFVPGMIFTLEEPQSEQPLFRRIFATIEPHTSGPARTCESCHRSTAALGLGQGELTDQYGRLSFMPEHRRLRDGLPADSWTNPSGNISGSALRGGGRPLLPEEIRRIWRALPEK